MKGIYNEFFYIPKNGSGKVREKVMLTRIALSVVLILACMAAISLTAYAYFSHEVSANVATVKSAKWEIVTTAEADVAVVFNSDFYSLNNSEGETERTFVFTVAKDEDNATATVGYARIDIKTDIDGYTELQTFYSQPIGRFLLDGEMTEDTDRKVKIVVPAGKVAQVKFTGEWGTCAKQPVVEEDRGIIPVFAEEKPAEEPAANGQEVTSVPETKEETAQTDVQSSEEQTVASQQETSDSTPQPDTPSETESEQEDGQATPEESQ